MALQGDQRALLQLLCERGQSYEDIAGLLGTSADDVRAKARAALTEIGGADPDAEVGLTDYLLGQADPIGRADAVRYLQSNPEALALAGKIEDSLRLIAPGANLPKLPEARGKPRRAAVPASSADDAPATTGGDADARATTTRQTRMMAAIAGAGVILVFVVLAIAGVFSGDDSEPSATASTTASNGDTTDAGADESRVTEVKLKPTGDSGVGGSAAFGIANQSQLYVDITVDGLDPQASKDSAYFFWLMIGDQGGYPLNAPLTPDQNGSFSGRIAVPTAVAQTVAGNSDTVKVSLTPVKELAAAAKQAAADKVPIVPFTGTELASGKIPLAAPAGQ